MSSQPLHQVPNHLASQLVNHLYYRLVNLHPPRQCSHPLNHHRSPAVNPVALHPASLPLFRPPNLLQNHLYNRRPLQLDSQRATHLPNLPLNQQGFLHHSQVLYQPLSLLQHRQISPVQIQLVNLLRIQLANRQVCQQYNHRLNHQHAHHQIRRVAPRVNQPLLRRANHLHVPLVSLLLSHRVNLPASQVLSRVDNHLLNQFLLQVVNLRLNRRSPHPLSHQFNHRLLLRLSQVLSHQLLQPANQQCSHLLNRLPFHLVNHLPNHPVNHRHHQHILLLVNLRCNQRINRPANLLHSPHQGLHLNPLNSLLRFLRGSLLVSPLVNRPLYLPPNPLRPPVRNPADPPLHNPPQLRRYSHQGNQPINHQVNLLDVLLVNLLAFHLDNPHRNLQVSPRGAHPHLRVLNQVLNLRQSQHLIHLLNQPCNPPINQHPDRR